MPDQSQPTMLDANVQLPVDQAQLPAAITRFYDAEAAYSLAPDPVRRQALLDTLHPSILLHQPESLPYGGTWRGRDGFGQWLDLFVATWSDIEPRNPVAMRAGTDQLIIRVTLCATSVATRRAIAMPMCQLIRIADDRPVEWHNFAWDTAALLATISD